MKKEFTQLTWGAMLEDDCRQIIRLAVREDLDQGYDWTTVALVPETAEGLARVVAREAGIVAGLLAIPVILDEMDIRVHWQPQARDGDPVRAGDGLGLLSGSARDLLTSERLILNLVGQLSGIASLTHQFVSHIAGTQAAIYDTRKTRPGYRRLDKYAVRCGGGRNHRTGLYDAVLIKDNHLAFGNTGPSPSARFGLAEAVAMTRQFLELTLSADRVAAMIVEIEVDTIEQLEAVLPSQPDIVLLDNMTLPALAHAVKCRDALGAATELEASGGVNLETVRAVAQTGVDRISVGSLTHSARSLDVGLDWLAEPPSPS